jgi:hypothetical protein
VHLILWTLQSGSEQYFCIKTSFQNIFCFKIYQKSSKVYCAETNHAKLTILIKVLLSLLQVTLVLCISSLYGPKTEILTAQM